MNTTVNLLLIIIALVIALERIAFSVIRKQDQARGLYLNDSSYTLVGTARLLFLSQEKRLKKEKEETFTDFITREKNEKKKLIIYACIYLAATLLSALLVFLKYSVTDIVLMNIALAFVAGSFIITKSMILAVLVLVYSIISGIYGISINAWWQLISMIAGLLFFAMNISVHLRYRHMKKPISEG